MMRDEVTDATGFPTSPESRVQSPESRVKSQGYLRVCGVVRPAAGTLSSHLAGSQFQGQMTLRETKDR